LRPGSLFNRKKPRTGVLGGQGGKSETEKKEGERIASQHKNRERGRAIKVTVLAETLGGKRAVLIGDREGTAGLRGEGS